MKRAVFVLAVCACFIINIRSAYAEMLKVGDVVYARSNLRAKASTIFWHNMSSSPIVVPVGTEVKIKATMEVIAFVTTDTNDWYGTDTKSKYWDRLFVKNRQDIGLEGLSADRKEQIKSGTVVVGMTKKEVYASKGCPAYSAWGKKTNNESLSEIMQSDKWYYMSNQRGKDVMVTFQDGAVVKIGGFEK